MSKLNLAVIFGGSSIERESSIESAITLINNLSREKYNIIPVYVNAQGNYFLYEGGPHSIKAAEWENFGTKCQIDLNRQSNGLLRISGERVKNVPVDVAIPLIRGSLLGGSMQGVLEVSGIKYVGATLMASSLTADNGMTKLLAKSLGIACPKHLLFDSKDLDNFDDLLRTIRYKLGYPCNIKPLKRGFSDGISIAYNKKELEDAVLTAFLYGNKIIAEKMVQGRELVCAILVCRDEIFVSGMGEVLPGDELCMSPKLNNEKISEIKDAALRLYKSMDIHGPACFKFFLEDIADNVFLGEIDTTLRFHDTDIYPRIMQSYLGISSQELIDKLIETALEH